MTRNGRPRARFAAQIARYSKTPVCRSTPTMIIMPSSRKMTFQSTPVSSEKNAVSASTAPISDHERGAAEGRGDAVDPLGGDQDVGDAKTAIAARPGRSRRRGGSRSIAAVERRPA